MKWEGIHANTAKVSKRGQNCYCGRTDNPIQNLTTILPPKEREQRKCEVEQCSANTPDSDIDKMTVNTSFIFRFSPRSITF